MTSINKLLDKIGIPKGAPPGQQSAMQRRVGQQRNHLELLGRQAILDAALQCPRRRRPGRALRGWGHRVGAIASEWAKQGDEDTAQFFKNGAGEKRYCTRCISSSGSSLRGTVALARFFAAMLASAT
jgi:hypothetical protein